MNAKNQFLTINFPPAMICFNYLQQRFYLIEGTMKTLARGTNSDAIFKLIKVLINMQQEDYRVALQGDTREINDVCSQISTNRELFGQEEIANGTIYNRGLDSSPHDDQNDEDKNMILGVNGNEIINKINTGKLDLPENEALKDLS